MLIADYFHRDTWTVNQNSTIYQAIFEMVDKRSNSIVVVDDKNYPVGVISIQDIAAAIVPSEFIENTNMARAMYKSGFFDEQVLKMQNLPVKDVMRKEFSKIDLKSNTLEILADFLQNDLYTVPIMDGEKMIGVATRSDVKKAIAQVLGIKY